jgi:nitrogenase subunit NifH
MRATIEQYAANLNIACMGAIREGIAVQEAAFLQQSLFTYAPKANPSQDYLKVYDALIAQE